MIGLKPPLQARGPLLNLYQPKAGDGCVLWLPGQDDAYSATIRDRSGKNNHGAITGATWRRLPSGLPYLYFDGDNDQVVVTHHASLNVTNMTYLFWWWNDSTLATQPIIVGKGGYGAGWYFQFDSYAKPYLKLGTGDIDSGDIIGTTEFLDADNIWRMAAYSYDQTTAKLYHNGVLEDSHEEASTIATNASNLIIGTYVDGSYDFKGGVALFRLIDRVLSPDEIKAIYQQERHLFNI